MPALYIPVAAITSLVLLYCARRRILAAVGAFLIRQDPERPFDAIAVLNGNISTRTYRAMELYRRHRAPLLLARLADTEEVRLGVIPNISDATGELLLRLGAASADIEILCSDRWVGGTWDEAVLLCARLRGLGCRRVAIVTDAFHTRRARWTFEKVMNDGSVEFFCVATRFSLGVADRWWRSEYGLVQVIVEYIKLVHYMWIRHRDLREADLPFAEETRRLVAGYGAPEAQGALADSAGRDSPDVAGAAIGQTEPPALKNGQAGNREADGVRKVRSRAPTSGSPDVES